jgi:hypothetical protein
MLIIYNNVIKSWLHKETTYKQNDYHDKKSLDINRVCPQQIWLENLNKLNILLWNNIKYNKGTSQLNENNIVSFKR